VYMSIFSNTGYIVLAEYNNGIRLEFFLV